VVQLNRDSKGEYNFDVPQNEKGGILEGATGRGGGGLASFGCEDTLLIRSSFIPTHAAIRGSVIRIKY